MDRLALQVLERLERHVQEVARAARGVEHGHRAQAVQEGLEHPARVVLGLQRALPAADAIALADELLHSRLHRRVLGTERRHQDGLHQALDRGAVGVVGAQLGPAPGVQAALEEGPEDGRLDLRPVELRDAPDDVHLGRRERDRRRAVEQAAVEPLDALGAEVATGA